MKTSFARTAFVAAVSSLLGACGSKAPPEEVIRPVLTAEVRYDGAQDTSRYFGSVQARFEATHAFRVGGKVMERRIDVGRSVKQGEVLAVLDDTDYRLAEQATRRQLDAATASARQAESDWRRLQALKADGSVSEYDEEQAHTRLVTSRAEAEAQSRKLALAGNQVEYTVLRASSSGVVTSVHVEVGQVVTAGQPAISIATEGEPEIVVDVPETHLEAFKASRYQASLASMPEEQFPVVLRELSAQAAAQTRTFRARLKPASPRPLPLGATATLLAERVAADTAVAVIPASAITQHQGKPALWAVRRKGAEPVGTVALVPVEVHGYRSDEILVSGPPAGALVVTAGVQKMSPGLRVALQAAGPVPAAAQAPNTQAAVVE